MIEDESLTELADALDDRQFVEAYIAERGGIRLLASFPLSDEREQDE